MTVARTDDSSRSRDQSPAVIPAGLPRINSTRLWQSLMTMAEIGATPEGGSNRLALTDADRAGRDLFVKWCREAGCEVRVDAIGNIFARRSGRHGSQAPILMGSHLDTQATGGQFDGVYGVLAALEVIRTLNDAGVQTDYPLEAVVWTNEEGARFPPAMMGSAVWAGVESLESAHGRVDKNGIRVDDELRRIGYLGEEACKAHPARAAFEVHIEQGPVLELAGKQIGIVTGIQGLRWFEITIEGTSCHAGTTPMETRRDPVRALAKLIPYFFDMADQYQPLARFTIGRIATSPGAFNTIPNQSILTIDVRHPDVSVLDHLTSTFKDELEEICHQYDLKSSFRTELACSPVVFSVECIEAIELAVSRYGYSNARMISGAAHDSMHLASVIPTAMIFVPCEGGISHNAAERARPEDLEAGCNVLLGAVLSLS